MGIRGSTRVEPRRATRALTGSSNVPRFSFFEARWLLLPLITPKYRSLAPGPQLSRGEFTFPSHVRSPGIPRTCAEIPSMRIDLRRSSPRLGAGWMRMAVTAVGCTIGLSLLARLAMQADAAATWRAVGSAGPLVAAGLLPFAISLAVDAYGTVLLLRGLGHTATLWQVLPVRIASEALHISMPLGVVAADTATAALLEARCDVPVRDGLVASLARRWLVMRAHGAYIFAGAVVGFPTLAALSPGLLGRPGLPWVVLASCLVPLAISAAVAASFLGRTTFARLHATLGRVPSQRLARWLQTRRHEAAATDLQATRLRAAGSATTPATLAFLGCWCLEAVESALLLHLVGAEVTLPAVFAIEAGLSLVRSAAVIAPSGLGIVDLGYGAVLPALGADAGAVPAFVLLKRAKELLWVLAGYSVIGGLRGRAASAAPSASPAT